MGYTRSLPEVAELSKAEGAKSASFIRGYSVEVLSSPEEIHSLRSFVRRSLLEDDPLLDVDFFLASVTKDWTPRVVVVRHKEELKGIVYAKERNISAFRLKVAYADLTFGSMLLRRPGSATRYFPGCVRDVLAFSGSRGIRLRVGNKAAS